jgi:acetylornithine aminotransferase/acetylornithine/N-succinyldiaminopimelate aminotransferase
MDGVQDGFFRTGRFQSFQRILENSGAPGFLPDAISMAKSLGGGFPIGAFWVRAPYADLLGPGTHGTTYGGSPLGCAVALKVFEVVHQEGLADNARNLGDWMKAGLNALAAKYPHVVEGARGLGFMLGLVLRAEVPGLPGDPAKPVAVRFVQLLHSLGLLAIPAGTQVVRLLPALNLRRHEAEEALGIIGKACAQTGPR